MEPSVISQESPAGAALDLKALGVHAVICGSIGTASLLNLQDQGIQVMGGAFGAAKDQVERFLNGQLHFETKESEEARKPGESGGHVSACGHSCF